MAKMGSFNRERATPDWIEGPSGEPSHSIRKRVESCRAIQQQRQGCANSELSSSGIDQYCVLENDGKQLLQQGVIRWGWSARAVHRLLRVARTLADMSNHENISVLHLAEAIQYRNVRAEQGRSVNS